MLRRMPVLQMLQHLVGEIAHTCLSGPRTCLNKSLPRPLIAVAASMRAFTSASPSGRSPSSGKSGYVSPSYTWMHRQV